MMNIKILKVSSILIAVLVFMPLGFLSLGSSASPIYENDGEEHAIVHHSLPGGSIDGIVGNEWPADSMVGHLWCTSESEPVGDIYMVHDNEILYIGAKATFPDSSMANDGQWIRIDWNRDSSMDIKDNMGNSGETEFVRGDLGFEYAIPMNQELIDNDRFDVLLHAELVGLPSSPEGETTTFPFRNPGIYFSTTMVLDYQIPNIPPVAMIAGYSDGLRVYLDGFSSYDTDGWITSYCWNFGDGQVSDKESITHIYDQPGEYTIVLTIEDDGGSQGYDTETIVVFIPEPEPEPEVEPENDSPANISYSIQYLYSADNTIVNESGIFFHTSVHPELYEPVYFNDTYSLPAEDYGTYRLYNGTHPVYFMVHITNNDDVAHDGIHVTTIQEYHNTVTLWDSMGQFTVEKGQPMGGESTSSRVIDLEPNQEYSFAVVYVFSGRGWGLDQTHIIITHDGLTLIDNPEAGVYCPP